MPELPEVELIKKGIEEKLLNQKLLKICVLDPTSVVYDGFRIDNQIRAQNLLKESLEKKVLRSCQRKGKLLILEFDGDVYLLIHLKMTGNLLIGSNDENKEFNHKRVIFEFEREKVVFNDIRKFGYIEIILGVENLRKKLGQLGLDALTELSDVKILAFQLKRSSLPIKKFLLSQNYISGIGNAYADEILFEARINPFKRVNTLRKKDVEKLFNAIRKKLNEGISSGGLTLRDYRNFYGEKGRFQEKLNVYGRHGEKCKVCGTSIERVKIGGRSSFFCKKCQK